MCERCKHHQPCCEEPLCFPPPGYYYLPNVNPALANSPYLPNGLIITNGQYPFGIWNQCCSYC